MGLAEKVKKSLKSIKFKKKLQDLAKNPEKYIKQKTVETKECQHKMMKQLIDSSAWYQCQDCKAVFYIYGVFGAPKDKMLHDIDLLKKKI